MNKTFFSILFLLLSATAYADTGLEIVAAGDLVYSQSLNDDSGANEKLAARGAEVMLFAPIDHIWDGVFSLAAHDEGGSTNFEVHELYVSTSKLIDGSRFKIGQFFLGIGRLNRSHQHDWPFTRAPKVHRDFLAEEAVFDAGVEWGTLLPTEFYLDLTVGVTSGHRFGHVHSSGTKPKTPTHYMRLATFVDFTRGSGLEIGSTYLGRNNSQGEKMQIVGLDTTFKWREGKLVKWLVSSEMMYRKLDFAGASSEEELGFYLFGERGWTPAFRTGMRLDSLKNFSERNLLQKKVNNIHWGATLQSSYQTSEFFKTRLSISHEFRRVEGLTQDKDTRAQLQFVFIIGAHPAHDF